MGEGEWDIILGGWGWVRMYGTLSWVGGGKWWWVGHYFLGRVGVGALFDNAYFKDTMKAYFCYRHMLFQTTTLSRLFYLI